MRWLSPFPADADRPWRGVLLYAARGVLDHARSAWFWASIVVMPAVLLAVVLGAAWIGGPRRAGPPRAAVVVPDDALRARVEALTAFGPWVVSPEPPAAVAPFDAVLWLEGSDVRAVLPRLELLHPVARRDAEEMASDLWLDLQADVLLPDDRPTTALAEQRAFVASLGSKRADLAATAAGFPVLIAVWLGLATGGAMRQQRDAGLIGVLRVGTPAAVLFLGGLLEATLLGLLRFGPYLVLPALGAGVLVLALGWGVLAEAAALTVLVAYVAATAFVAFASLGAALAAVGVGPRVVALVAVVGMPLLVGQMGSAGSEAFDVVAARAAIPWLGVGVLVKGAVLRRGLSFGLAGLALASLGALACARLGAWCYAADEVRWADVRALWRRR